jgi:hypothetical protein
MTTPTLGDDTQRSVRITTNGLRGTIEVDGADMSNDLAGYALDHRAGQPATLVLYAAPTCTVEFDGLATVVVADTRADGQAIAEWLDGIDPAALSRAALDRDDLDGGRNELTVAMLRQLSDWARGAS